MSGIILSSGYLKVTEIVKPPRIQSYFWRGMKVGDVIRIDYQMLEIERNGNNEKLLQPELFVYNMTTGRNTLVKHNTLVRLLRNFKFIVSNYKGFVFDNPNRDLKYEDNTVKEWNPKDLFNKGEVL